MEIIRGKHASFMEPQALAESLAGYNNIHIDVGTGDGRYVQHVARSYANGFAIGIDACRENLRDASRRGPENALFVIANAQALPCALFGAATHLTVNFPWGSLLSGLLDADEALLDGLRRLARAGAALDVRLNGGAMAEAGWTLQAGAIRVREVLAFSGFAMQQGADLSRADLRAFPTTWAKRLAYGRDPRAIILRGRAK